MRWFVRLLVSAVALYLTSQILDNLGPLSGLWPKSWCHMTLSTDYGKAALAILGLALVNSLVRPVVRLLSLPLTFATLGLSSLAINAVLFWAVGHFTGGYDVGGILGLLLGPIIMGLVNGLLSLFVRDREK